MKLLTFICGVCLLFASCKKEQDLSSIDLGYGFFPLSTGSFVIYKVDSVYHGITEQSYQYQIKEEVGEEFVYAENQPAFNINRYYRHANGDEWVLIDVWTARRTSRTAEKVIENIRYVKISFPTREGLTWNGNAYNNFPEQTYKCIRLNQFADVGILQFPQTVTVEEKNNVNLVDNQVINEIYAKDVGMVYRKETNLNTQGSQTSGFEVTYQAIGYSSE